MKKIFTLLFLTLQIISSYCQLCEPIDRTFGTDGIGIGFTTNGNNQLANPRNVVVQPDNKIIQAYLTNFGVSNGSFGLIRYHGDGRIDSSFGINGKVVTLVGNNESSPTKVTLQPDGKIIVVGNAYDNTGSDIAMVRYNIDGSLDASFGVLGKVLTSFGPYYDFATSVTLQEDKIIVVGASNDQMNASAWAIARFNANGSLDSSFGVNGKIIKHLGRFIEYIGSFYYGTYAGEVAMSVATQPDGKIIVGGQSYYLANCYDYYGALYCNNAFAMIRLNKDGSLDSSFGVKGKVSDSLKLAYATSIALQDDGKILTTGQESFGGVIVARYNNNGTIDGNFGSGGIVENSISVFNTNNIQSTLIAVGSKGRIFIGGQAYFNSGSSSFILVLSENGKPDSSFNRTGISTINFGTPSVSTYMSGFAIQGGKLLVSGSSFYNNASIAGVVRLVDTIPVIVPVISTPGSYGICPDESTVLRSSEKGTIQWYRNNLEITGARDSLFTTGAAGTYTVMVNNPAGCGLSAPVVVTVHAGPPEIFISYDSSPSGFLSTSSGFKKYQWYLNSVIIVGADSSKYTPLQNGLYTVSVTDSNSCSRTSPAYNFAITSITDITIGATKLQFFPNPANTIINIEMPQQPYDKVFAELYDLSGKRIQQLIINTGHNEMDVSALPAGTYQLQLYSRKERSVRKILIAR